VKFKYLLIAILVTGLLIGCHKKKFNPGEIIVGLEGSPSIFDPRLATDAYSARINSLIYDGLVRINERGEIAPDLAEKWEIKGKKVIFHIRKGVKFHNGKELTSRDVKCTIESILHSPSPYRNSLNTIEKIEIPDRYTVILHLKQIFAPLLTALAVGIVPCGDDPDHFKPVGTGPYMLKEFKRGEEVVLTRFENYFLGTPHLQKIIFKVIPDDTTRIMELERGEVSLLQNSIPPDFLPELKKNGEIEIVIKPGVNVSYLGFNLKDPILSRVEVRKAIALAINRDEIIKHLLGGLASKASSIISPQLWAYTPVTVPGYDPEKAEKLLDRAGYKRGADGIRFSLEYKTSTNRLRRRIAEVIARQLERVGIRVKVRSYEFGTFFSDIRKGNFQIYSLTWVGITDPDILYYAFDSHSIPPEGANRGHYHNEEFDKLVEEARHTFNKNKRKKLYAKALKILAEDLPIYPLWYHFNIIAYRKGLRGIKIHPGGDYYFLKDVYWLRSSGK